MQLTDLNINDHVVIIEALKANYRNLTQAKADAFASGLIVTLEMRIEEVADLLTRLGSKVPA